MLKRRSVFRLLTCLRSCIVLENTSKLKEKYFKLFKKYDVKNKVFTSNDERFKYKYLCNF